MSRLDERLRAWVEQAADGRVRAVTRPSAGGSRPTFLVDVEGPGGTEALVVRAEGSGSFTGTEVSLTREAAVYRALAAGPVPVPRVVALAGDGSALLMEKLPGTSDLATLPPHVRAAVLDDFIRIVAELHSLPVGELDLPGMAVPFTPAEHATLDIGMWRRLAGAVGDLDPLISYAGSWLLAHPPARVQRTVLVQGDTGPGNFLAHEGRVSGLIDMEFAHVGDPMDDVAWILWRSASLEGFDAGRVLDRYSALSGLAVDRASVDYYGAAVQYRCAVTTSLALARGGGARGWAPYLLVTQRFLVGLGAALGALVGVAEPRPPLPERPATLRTAWYDELLDGLRAAVRGTDDPELREATRNQQILVHYLRAYDRIGADVERLDADDARATFHAHLDGRELAERAEEAGAAGDPEVLAFLLRRLQRRSTLWATLLERSAR